MDIKLIKNQIQYLKDCYTLDNSSFTIQNFFDHKFEHQYLIKTEEEELLNQAYPKTFVPDEVGEPIEQVLILNSEDKELLYCSLFICGTQTSKFSNRLLPIISPLIYSHAALEKTDGDYYVSVLSQPQLNIGFLKTLEYKTDFESCRFELHKCLGSGILDFRTVGEIKSILDTHLIDINTDEVMIYPHLITKQEKEKCFKLSSLKALKTYKLISCSGILVSSKANNTETIDRELNQIIVEEDFSPAINTYFGGSEIPKYTNQTAYTPAIPMILNKSQEQVLKNVNAYPGSIIIGPPGTGKSFTITALAMDLIRQGKTVLIATKTERALQVIEEKLLDLKLENRFVKIGGKRYQQKVKKLIKTSLYGLKNRVDKHKYTKLKQEFNTLIKQLDRLERDYIKQTDYTIESSDNYLSSTGFLTRFLSIYHKNLNGKIGSEIDQISTFYKEINHFLVTAERYFKITLDKQLEDTIEKDRATFTQFHEALNVKDQASKLKQINAIDFNVILQAIPLWLTEIKSVSEFIPLHQGLFDVIIFDESTQCDMASCIPVLQRGKKLIIAGDTNQLRHFSFISKAQVDNKRKEYNLQSYSHLNYRANSMLDLMLYNTQHQNQLVGLNEHYRSLPSIIDFSNAYFYENQLNIMTAFPNHDRSKTISTIHVKGKRSDQGINNTEIEKVIEIIKRIINQNIDLDNSLSIGVLSPFRNQTEALTKAVTKEFATSDIKRHHILIGTPHSFQGSERDIMILSLSIDDDFHHGSISYLNKEDMFNVAITRAKKNQVVIHSFQIKNLPSNTLIKPYLEQINTPISTPDKRSKRLKQNPSYKEITSFLEQEEWAYYMNHYLAGMTIDILFKHDETYFAIDLIGFPGAEKDAFTMERYKILNRVGIKVFPLSFLTWNFNKTNVISKLKTFVLEGNTTSIYHNEPEISYAF